MRCPARVALFYAARLLPLLRDRRRSVFRLMLYLLAARRLLFLPTLLLRHLPLALLASSRPQRAPVEPPTDIEQHRRDDARGEPGGEDAQREPPARGADGREDLAGDDRPCAVPTRSVSPKAGTMG